MNLFNFLRFSINRFSPFGLGTKKYDDINWFFSGVHLEITPFSSSLQIARKHCCLSFLEKTEIGGGQNCLTLEVNGILYPLIQLRINWSEVMIFQLPLKNLRRPATELTLFSEGHLSVWTEISAHPDDNSCMSRVMGLSSLKDWNQKDFPNFYVHCLHKKAFGGCIAP